ncbi:Cyanate hydratase [Mycoemilia scoparia]|uniref:Cyanate hydratase n=1 Tax=Mycoemilia scoparia TaxID=417184 RepID=A0A9W8DQ45_9FUNG|nr:Cyanate hydratase [Mycoemilia scoparia]
MSRKNLPPASLRLFEAKARHNLTFEEIGKKIDHDEVWVASLFYGQVTPSKSDVERIASVLQLSEDALKTEYMNSGFPHRGELIGHSPPLDPLLYRLNEALRIHGPGIRDVIHEKCGDGIVSSVDFRAHVEKVTRTDGDRVRIIFDGKFLNYKSF